MHLILVIWNFGDEILLRGENVKPEKKCNFSEKGKNDKLLLKYRLKA